MANSPVVFITGASSGIGAALAREFAQRFRKSGCKLVLTARRLERLETLAGELRKAGAEVLVVSCDVTIDGSVEESVRIALQKFGRIDIVIANAGFGVTGAFAKLKLEDYRRQFETNVFGVLRTAFATQAELKRSQGTLVLIGSVAGYVSLHGSSPYSMSKFAVHALARSLLPEFKAKGASVVLIAPGFVESEIRQIDNQGKHRPEIQAPDRVYDYLKMPVGKAAEKIVAAILAKKSEAVITPHGKCVVWIQRHFPGVISFLTTRGLKGRESLKLGSE